jgi:hypothetical protein
MPADKWRKGPEVADEEKLGVRLIIERGVEGAN